MFEATEVVLEPGAYRAQLKKVEVADGKNYDTGEPEDYRRWTFEITEEGYEGTELLASSSMAFGPQAKARQWVEALVGRKIERGEKIAEDELVGREVDLGIQLKETDRGTFPRVDSVHPVRKKSRKTEQAETKKVKDVRDGRAPVDDSVNDDELESIPF